MSEENPCPNCGNEQNGIFPCPHSAALGAAEAQLAAVKARECPQCLKGAVGMSEELNYCEQYAYHYCSRCDKSLKAQLAAVTKERDDWKLLSDCHTSSAQDLIAENASLREELRDARPLVEQFVNAYVSGERGSPADRQDQLRRLERIDAALKDRP